MSYPELSILIPAAGASKRLGQAKQLVRYKNGTLLQNAINSASSIGPREIIVVTGAGVTSVQDAVQQAGIHWVHNHYWSDGMGSSIAVGASAISPGSSGVMILLCDQWRIEAQDIQLLADTWRSRMERIVCARAEGQNMPPVIFPASLFRRLRTLNGETGARKILKELSEKVTPIPLINAAFDLDTQADLNQLIDLEL
ncbi:MAG TPA: nucleotidyltransferase family protein [Xanthomonadales bacterium]